jgi:hypothetical protein
MSVILRGFPTEIGKEIEMPDMAELLSMPIFFDTDIDSAYRHGTEFQRKLIDSTPLKRGKNVYSVLSEVRMLAPSLRSCTGGQREDRDYDREWHIDCEENEDGPHIYHEERDIVHLLTTQATSMTEFNANELELDFDPSRSYSEFMDFVYRNRHLVQAMKMPANRIVTFSNHMHRATDPTRIEFKYMFRIVETDRKRPAHQYDPDYVTQVVEPGGANVPNIEQTGSRISIYVPKSIMEDESLRSSFPVDVLNEASAKENLSVDYENFDNREKFRNMVVDVIGWENALLRFDSNLNLLVRPNTIMLATFLSEVSDAANEHRFQAYKYFFDKVKDVPIVLYEADNPGNYFTLSINEVFYDSDEGLAGVTIKIPDNEVQYLKPIEYSVRFSEDFFRFTQRERNSGCRFSPETGYKKEE